MDTTTHHSTYKVGRTIAALAAAALATAAGAQTLNLYTDPDGDGVYEKAGAYPTTYADAIRAFLAAGGAPFDGTGGVLNAQRVAGVAAAGPQSFEGFVAFLDQTYGNVRPRTADCDDLVLIDPATLTWTCNDLPCPPDINGCDWFFARATARYECINEAPCPTNKPRCAGNGVAINIVAFDTRGGPACTCADNRECIVGPGIPTGGGIFHDNNICDCIGRPCPPDWNTDGFVNSQDLFDFLIAFFNQRADFNQDGFTNSQDFFDFLSAFFEGC